MSIVSLQFLLYVCILVFLYYILPKRFQWFYLLLASILYYWYVCGSIITLLMLGDLVIVYGITQLISFSKKPKLKKFYCIIGVILSLAILLVLKDFKFFTGFSLEIAAPLGISFYSLVLIGYILDVYWEKIKPQNNILKFALFPTYFPQISSGPFVRYEEMSNQLYISKKFNYENLRMGVQRIAWGFFLKLVISERLAVMVNTIYDNIAFYSGFYIFIAVTCFVFQLYTDFSGYMHIVLGISEILGINLPENFKTPFFSRSLAEFWRRWHITLGLWMKDYVMYPILKSVAFEKIRDFSISKFGKKIGKQIPTYIALVIIWFLVGFWHGGAWNFIFGVGLLQGFFIIIGQITKKKTDKLILKLKIKTDCFSWHLFQSIRTFFLFALGVCFFRAGDIGKGFYMLKKLVTKFNPWIFLDGSMSNLGLDSYDLGVLCFSLLVLLIVSSLQQKYKVRELLAKQNIVFSKLLIMLLIFMVIIFGFYGLTYDESSFIYQQF